MSERSFRVLVLGATGLVGREILGVLEERAFPVSEIFLFADEETRGSEVEFARRSHVVDTVGDDLPEVDVAFLCGPADVNRRVGAAASAKGALVIDLEAGTADDVVLGPGDSGTTNARRPLHLANPATRLIVAPLRALGDAGGIRRVVVTLVVPASAFGSGALDKLGAQTISLLSSSARGEESEDEQSEESEEEPVVEDEAASLAFRCAPLGSEEELVARARGQAERLLGAGVAVSVHAVRAPVFYGQAASISVETTAPIAIDEVKKRLREAPSVILVEGVAAGMTTFDTLGIDAVQVSSLRADASSPAWIHFWAMAENVRQGAALPAVTLAESLLLRH